MNLNSLDMKSALYELLLNGKKLKVKLKDGFIGCADVQDVCEKEGFVILFKKNDNYMINSISEDENLLCVDSFDYISEIVDEFEEI